MQVTERLQGEALIIVITGRLTFYSRKVFQAVIRNAGTTGAPHIILNIQDVEFMDSAALGILALAYLNLMAKDVHVSLVAPQNSVRNMLDQVNFSTLIPTFSSEEQALNSRVVDSKPPVPSSSIPGPILGSAIP